MGGAKPWQIAVVVLGILSLLWVLIYQLGSIVHGTRNTSTFCAR